MAILCCPRAYSHATLASDLLAAVIVTIKLIPQSLADALLAGLPPRPVDMLAKAGLVGAIAAPRPWRLRLVSRSNRGRGLGDAKPAAF